MGKHGMDFVPWRFGRLADSPSRLAVSSDRLVSPSHRLTVSPNDLPGILFMILSELFKLNFANKYGIFFHQSYFLNSI